MSNSVRECPQCGDPVEGRPNKKFCSDACKGRYFRENSEPEEENDAPGNYTFSEKLQPTYYGESQQVFDTDSSIEDEWEIIKRQEEARRKREEEERKARADEGTSKKIHEQFCVLVKGFLAVEGVYLTAEPVDEFLDQLDELADTYRNHPYLKLSGNLVKTRLKELYHIQDIIREVGEDIENDQWSQKARFELTGKWRKQLRELLISD